MLHKTRGIVFKTTDYSESSVVAHVFTEKFGLQSYLINGVRKPRAKISQNMLQPLFLLDMVVYHKPNGNIQRISELKHLPVFNTIPYDMVKSSLVMFLNEVLYKSIRQHNPDEVLFEFLFHAIEILDRLENGLIYFHLYFLLRLTRFLGFYPDRTLEKSAEYFDLKNGDFTNELPLHLDVLYQPLTRHWADLLACNFNTLDKLAIPSVERRVILQKIIDFYQLHIENLGNIKSHHVLEEVLS
ncbi:MAG: repair protein RecO [Sphingobacteriales bacterium]|nr:repair protein RecO [Sphingobacteriales bacterium]